jgi:hypothetical protein
MKNEDCSGMTHEPRVNKFKLEITVEWNDFVIPLNKSQSMINGMQREQVAFVIQDKLADMNPQIHNVYKQRS